MAHYAFLDSNNIVTEVIVGRNEDEIVDGITDWETYYGSIRSQKCKRTSYNNRYRKTYAGVGYQFREDLNAPDGAFIQPKPFESWVLNEKNCTWEAPVPYPMDGANYGWNEISNSWEILE